MAYNPTTWNTDEVITKDKLNKIEQGINTASKLSGTDIDTDKNWNGKEVTNMAIRDATYVGTSEFVLVPSSHANVHLDTSTVNVVNGWGTVKTVTVPSRRSGTVSVYFIAIAGSSGLGEYKARVLLNDVPVAGSEISVRVNQSQVHFVDVAVVPGDVIALQLYSNGYGTTSNLFAVRAVTLPVYPDAMTW